VGLVGEQGRDLDTHCRLHVTIGGKKEGEVVRDTERGRSKEKRVVVLLRPIYRRQTKADSRK